MNLPEGFYKEVIEARENALNKDSDSIKSKVSTIPLKSGGASFKTNVLIEASNSKLIYKPSIGAALFSFLFFAIGFGILFFGMVPIFRTNADFSSINWFLLIFGFTFGGAGGFMFYYFYKPRVFDKQ